MGLRDQPWAALARDGRVDGWTELAWAVECLDTDEVRRLLEDGADPNEYVFHGQHSILHWAIDGEGMFKSNGNDDQGCKITKLLIDHGADLTALDSKGRSPLDCARQVADTGAEAELLSALNERKVDRDHPGHS